MRFVFIFGPQAVGKMTVGEELARQTGMKLFHNHMSIEMVNPIFPYGTPEGKHLVKVIRREVFETALESDQLEGLIFTYVWALDAPADWLPWAINRRKRKTEYESKRKDEEPPHLFLCHRKSYRDFHGI